MSKEGKFKFETTIYIPPGHRLLKKEHPEEIIAYHLSQILAGPTGYTNSVEPMFFTELEKVHKLRDHAEILATAVRAYISAGNGQTKFAVTSAGQQLLDLAKTTQNMVDWLDGKENKG